MANSVTRKTAREAAADHLGLFLEVTADVVDTGAKTITVGEFVRNRPSMEHFTHAYVTQNGEDYERITTIPDAAGVCSLSGNLAGVTNGTTVYVYFLLTPVEWNTLLDRILQTELEFRAEYDIAIVAGTNEYALTLVEMRSDILDIFLVDESTADVWRQELGAWRITGPTSNAFTLHIPLTVLNNLDSSVEIRIVYKSRYPVMTGTTDAKTTTCPFPLLWSSLAAGAVEKIQTKHGQAVAQKFDLARRQALRMKIKLAARMNPPYEARDFNVDTPMTDFVDIPSEILDGSW